MRVFSKLTLWGALICLSLLAAGCEEDDDDDETSTQVVAYAYVANFTDSVNGYIMDTGTGRLTPMADSPFPASTPRDLAVMASGEYMVIRSGSAVSLKRIESETGRIITVPGSGSSTATMAGNMTCAAAAGFCFVNDSMSTAIYRHGLDLDGEQMTTLSNHTTTSTPDSIAYDATGGFLYATAPGAGTVMSYALDPDTGALTDTPSSPNAVGSSPKALAVDPQGEFVAVHDDVADMVFLLSIDASGDVTVEDNEAQATDISAMSFHPTLDLLFGISLSGIDVFTLDRSAMTLTLLAGSPFEAGSLPASLAFSPDGTYLLVGDQSDTIVQVFELDPDGTPVQIDGSPFDSQGGANSILVVDPSAAD